MPEPVMRWIRRSWQVAWAVVSAFNRDNCPFLAAAIGYFALFSVFPLLLGEMALLGYLISPEWAERQVLAWFGGAIPPQLRFVPEAIAEGFRSRGPMGGLATLVLLWSGKNLFMSLAAALDLIWGAPPLSRWQDIVSRHVVASLCTLGVGAAVIVAAGLYWGLSVLLKLRIAFLGLSPAEIPGVLWVLSHLLPGALIFLSLVATYRILPAKRLGYGPILVGAAIGSLLWELTRQAFGLYIALASNLSVIYGMVGGIVLFLLWIDVSAQIVLLGAEISGMLAGARGKASPGAQHPPVDAASPGRYIWLQDHAPIGSRSVIPAKARDEMALKAMRELPDYEMAPGSPDVLGWSVHDRDDRVVGTVFDLLVDTSTDEVVYLGVQLGDGKCVVLPVGSLDLDEEMGIVRVLELSREQIHELPTYSPPKLSMELEERYYLRFRREEPVGAWTPSPLDYELPHFKAQSARMRRLTRAPQRKVPLSAAKPAARAGGVALFAANMPWDIADAVRETPGGPMDHPGPHAELDVLWQAEQPGIPAALGASWPAEAPPPKPPETPESKGEIAELGPHAKKEVLWQAEQPGIPSAIRAIKPERPKKER